MNQGSQQQPLQSLLYQTLFEQVTDGILLLDGKGQMFAANAPACQMVGYPQTDLLQRAAGDLIAPWPLPDVPRTELGQMAGKRAAAACQLCGSIGSPRIVQVRTQQLDEHHTLALLHDATASKGLEERLQTSKALSSFR